MYHCLHKHFITSIHVYRKAIDLIYLLLKRNIHNLNENIYNIYHFDKEVGCILYMKKINLIDFDHLPCCKEIN